MKSLSCVQLVAIPWTAAYQAPQSTGFSRQEYWSGLPLPSPSTKLETKLKTVVKDDDFLTKANHLLGMDFYLYLCLHMGYLGAGAPRLWATGWDSWPLGPGFMTVKLCNFGKIP